jgi:hypothetical protein
VDGDEHIQTRAPPAVHDYVLVVERLEVAVYRGVRLCVAGSIRAGAAHGAGGGDQFAVVVVGDPVPDGVACDVPVLVLELAELAELVEPGCVVEPEALGDCPVCGAVVAVEGDVEAGVEALVEGDVGPVVEDGDESEPPVGSLTLVPPLCGVEPPPIFVEMPPVPRVFFLVGTATVFVEVVTVVGVAAASAGVIVVCGCNGVATTAGAASSGGSTLE